MRSEIPVQRPADRAAGSIGSGEPAESGQRGPHLRFARSISDGSGSPTSAPLQPERLRPGMLAKQSWTGAENMISARTRNDARLVISGSYPTTGPALNEIHCDAAHGPRRQISVFCWATRVSR